MNRKAIVLVSGGLDSAATLAIDLEQNFDCDALSFDYGQRHIAEINAAKRIVESFKIKNHKIFNIDLTQIGESALTDTTIDVPETPAEGIPVTYVPARNTIFLSLALAYAETQHTFDIFIGVNAVDYSGYPDCRPEYIESFARTAKLATRAGVEGANFTIHTPLIKLSKSEIIKKGQQLGVNYSLTVSCYQADEKGHACGVCDSCRIRIRGFNDAGISDPTTYQTS